MTNVTESPAHPAAAPPANPLIRIGVDMGPLIAFFGAYFLADKFVDMRPILVATGSYMFATMIALTVGYVVEKRIAPMPLITGVIVVIFGSLTFLLDETFIYIKPTFINVLFATVLTAGLLTGRNWMQFLFKDAFNLTDEGWTKMTWRWVGFFLLLAVLNELVWRNFSEAFWVNFKVFGVLPLTIVFTMLQVPFLTKHSIDLPGGADTAGSAEEPSPPQ